MQIAYHQQYRKLSDRQLIDLVLSGNEEAMLFLIFEKYSPLLKKLCTKYYGDLYYLEQLQVEHLYLRNFRFGQEDGELCGRGFHCP